MTRTNIFPYKHGRGCVIAQHAAMTSLCVAGRFVSLLDQRWLEYSMTCSVPQMPCGSAAPAPDSLVSVHGWDGDLQSGIAGIRAWLER